MMDLDDTLIQGYLQEGVKKWQYNYVKLLPHRSERIMRIVMTDSHACFAIITNQGGVAFGYNTVEQVHAKISVVLARLLFFLGKSFSVHTCFHHPHAPEKINGEYNPFRRDSSRRKPGCGMLEEAMEAHRIEDRADAIYVGDMETDKEAAAAAGVAYVPAEEFFRSRRPQEKHGVVGT